ncbi:hypothetical protein OEB99_16530 [Actinotalea sp. M2MS4P-6]|uniref:hypothetical protein n=1 Tax=Actinotalea sp. M2MS4P-6 TaxID=2983762 RepID=UPI0021E3AE75|nr:hypothetical protein [Actinotalea sp. M2MS4P-6]MCV2395923.1 hypothetical protein [Actinotalea sp. M2MS4P-6]
MPGRIVSAWRTDTTPPRSVEIPEHWLGHPTLGKNYSAERPTEPAPTEEPPTDSATDPVAETPATPARRGPKTPVAGDKED